MRTIRAFGVAGSAALLALSAASVARTAAPTASTFVKKAGASDLYERDSSRLVLQSTKNPKIRTFANKMIADHTQSTSDVKAAAMQAHMTPAPPMLDPMQTRNMAALRAATGTARDTLYVQQQKPAHQMALQLMQSYASGGTVPSLKTAAGKIAPVVQSHIGMLNGM